MGNGNGQTNHDPPEPVEKKYPEFVKIMWESGNQEFPNVTWIPFDRFVKMCDDRICDLRRKDVLGD